MGGGGGVGDDRNQTPHSWDHDTYKIRQYGRTVWTNDPLCRPSFLCAVS